MNRRETLIARAARSPTSACAVRLQRHSDASMSPDSHPQQGLPRSYSLCLTLSRVAKIKKRLDNIDIQPATTPLACGINGFR